ncbi:MAG TPA: PQQ-dependent sugar dehydrogenase [Kofleriaceae bacterium]|nr:PQQ-dependent sugar dehydrogenase [Kofleriaceae bacterium]
MRRCSSRLSMLGAMKLPHVILLALPLAGCGGNDNKATDAGPKDSAIDSPVDATVLPPACAAPVSGTGVRFRKIGSVSGTAILVTAPPTDPRLFVIEQRGTIRIFADETLLSEPFLDLSADAGGPVVAGGELGLLGLAFHPQYATNGTFYVFYTHEQSPPDAVNRYRDVLARCQVSATDPNKADATSCVEMLSIPDFASNHNGGMIEFGADGYLYIGTGDGGAGGDPNGNGQSLQNGTPVANSQALLGKMLRIDVDNKAPGQEYGIPADNPFAAGGGAAEIYQYGLRNPWRWSFDRATGDMWIADVGQDAIEELDVVTAAEAKGKNFGWDMWEASSCFTGPCTMTDKTFPQDERPHNTGWASIIGGQVYRGACFPDLVGTYFYSDHVGSRYAKATFAGGNLTVTDLVAPAGTTFPSRPTSLHADARGELFLTTFAGDVYRLEAAP